MRTSDGGIASCSTVVKGDEPGDPGLNFRELITPNINNAASGQGMTIDQIKGAFIAAQRDLIKGWDAPGFSDVWYS